MQINTNKILHNKLINFNIVNFVGKIIDIKVKNNVVQYVVTNGVFKHVYEIKENDVFLVLNGNFKLLLTENKGLIKVIHEGLKLLNSTNKKPIYHLNLFKFLIDISQYVQNNDEGYIIPHYEKIKLKRDISLTMEKLDGYRMTNEYKKIMEDKLKYIF